MHTGRYSMVFVDQQKLSGKTCSAIAFEVWCERFCVVLADVGPFVDVEGIEFNKILCFECPREFAQAISCMSVQLVLSAWLRFPKNSQKVVFGVSWFLCRSCSGRVVVTVYLTSPSSSSS